MGTEEKKFVVSRRPLGMTVGLLLVIGCIAGGSFYGIAGMQHRLDQMYAPIPSEAEAAAAALAPLVKRAIVGNPAHGKELFNMSCYVCHGPTGAGVPSLGANLRGSKFIATREDKDLIAFIKIGRQPGEKDSVMNGTMPPKGGNPTLDDRGLQDVVAFLRGLQAEQAATASGAAATAR